MVEFEKVDMDEFIAGCVQRFCPVCGTQIRQKETGRPRKFCSDPCRRRYWKAHPKPEQWDSKQKAEKILQPGLCQPGPDAERRRV